MAHLRTHPSVKPNLKRETGVTLLSLGKLEQNIPTLRFVGSGDGIARKRFVADINARRIGYVPPSRQVNPHISIHEIDVGVPAKATVNRER